MIKYLFFSLIFIFILLNNAYAESNSEDICTKKNTKNKIININKDVIFCYGPEGLTIKHFENTHNFQFINHIESQFYLIKTLPTGFRCRDGVLVGRAIPPPKYQPENALYVYKLTEAKYGLEPLFPAVADKIRYGKYLMTLARHEGRKMRALAILRYNGLKNISNGEVLFLPLTDKKSSTFRVEKCRIVMNEQAKMINKLTIKRR